jgi:hypothetical protein
MVVAHSNTLMLGGRQQVVNDVSNTDVLAIFYVDLATSLVYFIMGIRAAPFGFAQ